MATINNSQIEAYVSELGASLGFRSSINLGPILDLLARKRIQDATQVIAEGLGLPIRIVLSDASSVYDRRRAPDFASAHLVNVDSQGHAQGAVTAEVSVPDRMPMFGTSALSGYPIYVRISDECYKYPNTFISVMAHELSHVLLAACYHREQHNEVFTDLTAMALGFDAVTEAGRKTIESKGGARTTTTYGYMTDSQFSFAMKTIAQQRLVPLRQHRSAMVQLEGAQKRVPVVERRLTRTEAMLRTLDQHLPKHMNRACADEVIGAHQPGYFEERRAKVERIRTRLRHLEAGLAGRRTLEPLPAATLKELSATVEEMAKAEEEITRAFRAALRYAPVKVRGRAFIQRW